MKRIFSFLLVCCMTVCLMGVCALASGESSSGEPDTEMPDSIESRITACLYLDGQSGEQEAEGCTYTATAMDQSCVYAKNGAVYTLMGAVLDKPEGILSTATSFTVPTGEVLWSTTEAGSSGVNSVALAWGEGTVLTLKDCRLLSYYTDDNGEVIGDDERLIGVNGAMATYGGKLVFENVEIIAAGEGGHGIDTTGLGEVEISDSTIVTYGKKASGLTTDQPGGTIIAKNVDVTTHKSGSAAVYCDGNSYVSVEGGRLESYVEPAAVVCTDGVLELTGVELVGHEDAALNAHFPSTPSTVTCTDCSFTSASSSAVTSYAATNMVFDNCTFAPADGCYIFMSVPGTNSSGGISADKATVTMKNCRLEGGIWADEENGASVDLLLENSAWTVTMESVLTTFTVDDNSYVQGVMYVNGVQTPITVGTYTNVVLLPE
ncbi:MAG: right-handed parallel beta-helix repeat-containing protein [Oscillospiraceae bacterium]